MTYSIVTEGLVKRFGETLALDGIDLAVRTGSVFGLLGPNGAGKTTTMQLMLGLIHGGGRTLFGGCSYRDLEVPGRVVGAMRRPARSSGDDRPRWADAAETGRQ